MEKIIIFDWGGVILKEYPEHYCDQDAIKATIKKFNVNLTDDEAYQIYLASARDDDNKIISTLNDEESKYKWYKRIKDKGNLNATYEEFVREFINNYKKIDKYEEVVNYIYSLKGQVPLALLTDLIFVCFESLKKHIDLQVFDRVFLSYEEGYDKSDIKAFINVENKLRTRGANILLIDNNPANINNAKKRGWNTCQAYGYELDKIKKSVQEFLNK